MLHCKKFQKKKFQCQLMKEVFQDYHQNPLVETLLQLKKLIVCK